jgi:hypothetical protein
MAWERRCTSYSFVVKTSFGLTPLVFYTFYGGYWTDRIRNGEIFQKAKEEILLFIIIVIMFLKG